MKQTPTAVITILSFCGVILARLLIYIWTLCSGGEVLGRHLAASGTRSSANWFDLTLSTAVNGVGRSLLESQKSAICAMVCCGPLRTFASDGVMPPYPF